MNTSIPHLGRRTFGLMIAALPAAALAQGADPLPSWREGPRKRALLDFVASVTREGSAGYVPPAERIAALGGGERLARLQAFFRGQAPSPTGMGDHA